MSKLSSLQILNILFCCTLAQSLTIYAPKNEAVVLASSDALSNEKCVNLPLLNVGEKSFYIGTYFKANYFVATEYCKIHGMNLAVINSSEENDKLVEYIKNSGFDIEGVTFWLSGTDLGKEGRFVWLTNGRPFTYTNWFKGQPDNYKANENCAELWNLKQQGGFKWNDRPCISEQYFVCEIQN